MIWQMIDEEIKICAYAIFKTDHYVFRMLQPERIVWI